MQRGREPRTRIAVRPEAAFRARPRLFAALEDAFPVSFGPDPTSAVATIALGAEAPGGELPSLHAASADEPTPRRAEIELAHGEPLDRRICGIHLRDTLGGATVATPHEDVEVLASSDSRPAWTLTRGSPAAHRVAASLPELEPPQTLRELLFERPLAILALVEFLRSLTAGRAVEQPPLRAAILFDDPNLRWRTYGFIHFERLLAHADAHDYHASMATIPLDGGRQHRETVGLFRRRPDRLSLAFHGNDHLTRELVHVASDAEAAVMVAQALRRVARIESRYGLRIDRVMTPPHGMCSASVARVLAPLGFDALCSIHPLPWRESVPPDRPLAGWEPADFAAGCAVIPRLPFTVDPAEIALRAYLNQPLVLYGHHEDLAGGLDPLADVAARVNAMGKVRWASLAEIAASNWAASPDGATLRVRPYSHRLRLDGAGAAHAVTLERPRRLGGEFPGWTIDGSGPRAFGEPAPLPDGEAELRLAPTAPLDPATVPAPPARPSRRLRRVATEARDRLRPLVQVGGA